MSLTDLREERYLDTDQDIDVDLNALIGELKPNLLTPHLEELVKANPAARGNLMARYIVKGLAKQRGKISPIDILHDGETYTVRFLDVSPLCEGPWAAYSLMLLPLSFGEQCSIIETFYPKRAQLMAKAFAALFAADAPYAPKKQDSDVLDALEQVNAGVAMILARMNSGGALHADSVGRERDAMAKLAESFKERKAYKEGFTRSQQKVKKEDKA